MMWCVHFLLYVSSVCCFIILRFSVYSKSFDLRMSFGESQRGACFSGCWTKLLDCQISISTYIRYFDSHRQISYLGLVVFFLALSFFQLHSFAFLLSMHIDIWMWKIRKCQIKLWFVHANEYENLSHSKYAIWAHNISQQSAISSIQLLYTFLIMFWNVYFTFSNFYLFDKKILYAIFKPTPSLAILNHKNVNIYCIVQYFPAFSNNKFKC